MLQEKMFLRLQVSLADTVCTSLLLFYVSSVSPRVTPTWKIQDMSCAVKSGLLALPQRLQLLPCHRRVWRWCGPIIPRGCLAIQGFYVLSHQVAFFSTWTGRTRGAFASSNDFFSMISFFRYRFLELSQWVVCGTAVLVAGKSCHVGRNSNGWHKLEMQPLAGHNSISAGVEKEVCDTNS